MAPAAIAVGPGELQPLTASPPCDPGCQLPPPPPGTPPAMYLLTPMEPSPPPLLPLGTPAAAAVSAAAAAAADQQKVRSAWTPLRRIPTTRKSLFLLPIVFRNASVSH